MKRPPAPLPCEGGDEGSWEVPPSAGFPRAEPMPSFEVDVQRRWPSVEKARRLLGWEARIELEDGIADTIRWLREQQPIAG